MTRHQRESAGRDEPSASPYFDHLHVTVIEPPRGWRMVDWRELLAYRELLWVLGARDIQVRYKQTVLGVAWAVIRPVLMMLIFSTIFGHFAGMPSDGVPYPIFVYAGLLPWNFFAAAVPAAAQSMVGSSNLISKVYFPRLVVPAAAAGAGLVDLLISAAILLIMIVWYGSPLSPALLALPALVALLVFVSFGIGVLLCALTVLYRDFAHITPFLIQVWMYLTPVVFPVSIVPPQLRWLLYANPMTGVVNAFRAVFLGQPLDMIAVASSFVSGLVFFLLGIAYFEKAERRFVDVI
jgi:lipopolysaccharide transport system permease protein